jgi:hypothetical protein
MTGRAGALAISAAALGAAFLTALWPAGAARAADEEIQVYIDDMSAKGGYGLDVHVNDVLQGRGANADYAGEQASQGRLRITPEWAYGLTSNIELGAYLPLLTFDDHGHGEIAGVKGRIKFIAPHAADDPFFWGLNFELGKVRRDVDINPWNAELKGIAGYRTGPWTIAENLNIDWAVSGPTKGPVTYQLATMVTRKIGGGGFDVGFESYNGLGDVSHFGRLGRNDQELFAIVDKSFDKWDVNFGVGTGYGRPEDRLIVKAIIGVPIGG